MFVELTKAYEENDLKKVEGILTDLQKGIFKARSETVTALDKLKIIKQQLSQKVAQLKQAIDEIENSESYHLVSEIVDWDSYFDEQKEQLTQERDRLTKKLGDMPFWLS